MKNRVVNETTSLWFDARLEWRSRYDLITGKREGATLGFEFEAKSFFALETISGAVGRH